MTEPRSGGARGVGGGEEGGLYRGGNFARKCISTTPVGAPIYIWPRASIPPPPLCSATGALMVIWVSRIGPSC